MRIDEVLREKISSGKKLVLSDMSALQQDVIDIIARRITPRIIKIASEVTQYLSKDQNVSLEEMLEILAVWNASFDKKSVGASVYTRWSIQFYRSLFHKYTANEEQRMAYSDNYHWSDTTQRMI